MSSEVQSIFSELLKPFAEFESLRRRLAHVLASLPESVQRDFLEDPRFRIAPDNYVPGKGWSLWVEIPASPGGGSRCVVLRPRLEHCSEAFAHYVIAHELAHAFLRNGGWGEIVDREEAADALAAEWGFRRPNVA